MTEKDALAWGNAELAKLHLNGMMKFRSGTHSGVFICVDLVSTEGYPVEPLVHVAGLLLDYEFADDYRTAVGRILLRVRLDHNY
jgi:hypothetical protein